jgi:hypothetical protein
MFRLLIFCALISAVASPAVRERIRPYMDPILDPTYEWSVRSRVSEIARKIETERAAGRPVPAPGSIESFVSRHYRQKDGALDPWGTPFHLVRTSGGMRVASAGRDHLINTGDDVFSPPLPDMPR